ncbi:MAG: hypothetical protein HY308_02555 [Gammaproteobacteria bacterium]|nr:hypothetical protein [Gammaproteobacteria bacterium]
MEHQRRIQNAIDYIEDYLHGDLSTAAIANVAGFSKWHFQMTTTNRIPMNASIWQAQKSKARIQFPTV